MDICMIKYMETSRYFTKPFLKLELFWWVA
jgi:hypothetical protein